MAFRKSSRFAGGTVGRFKNKTVVYEKVIDYNSLDTVANHKITAGQEFREDLISLDVYGRSDLGDHIMRYNQIDEPKFLKAGVTLEIPAVIGIRT